MAVSNGGCLNESEGAGTEWKGGTEHEVGNLVRDKEIVLKGLGIGCGEYAPGCEFVVWELSGSGWC